MAYREDTHKSWPKAGEAERRKARIQEKRELVWDEQEEIGEEIANFLRDLESVKTVTRASDDVCEVLTHGGSRIQVQVHVRGWTQVEDEE